MKHGLIIGGKSEGGIGEGCASWFQVDPRYRNTKWLIPYQEEFDVSDEINIYNYLEGVQKTGSIKGFDYILYAAGLNELSWADEESISQMTRIYKVNVFGFIATLGVHRHLWPDKEFSAVAISSDAATNPMRGSVTYCSSKAALDMAVRTLAREWNNGDEPEVRVNAVSPGMVDDTPMSRYIEKTVPSFRGWTKEHALAYERSMQPMGRRCSVSEVAQLVADVLHGPRYLNGAIIPLTGAK